MHAISGTMLRDLLVCERRLGLDLHADPSLRDTTSPFVRMLWADGLAHEEQVLEAMIDRDMVDLRGLPRSERARAGGRAPPGALRNAPRRSNDRSAWHMWRRRRAETANY